MLSKPESAEFDHPAAIIHYRVTDIHGAYRRLRAQGVSFARDPHLLAKMRITSCDGLLH